jgi:micrococcal nuclease
MVRVRGPLLCAALIAVSSAVAAQAPALVGQTFEATVVRIADGDSVEIVRAGEKARLRVRLEGVDAPELGEVFSREAQDFLRRLALDRRVSVSGRDVDRYGRLVARVALSGQDLSFALVTAGLACQRFATDAVLAAAESRARASGAGFWSANVTTRPQCVARSRGASAASPAPAPPGVASPSAQVRGNVSSGLYHRASCPNFRCRNCTRVFASPRAAEAAGFKPAADCAR